MITMIGSSGIFFSVVREYSPGTSGARIGEGEEG
jgi:hypothetical protein